MPGRAYAFPRDVRLRRRSEFLKVQERGARFTSDCLICLVLPGPTPGGPTRLGLTVSTKVGNAVVRNRIRRRLRELFRTRRSALPRGLDMVVIARTSAAGADWSRLSHAFARVGDDLGRRYGR